MRGERRDAAGERVLVDGTAPEAHRNVEYRLVVEGTGPLLGSLRQSERADGGAKHQAGSLFVLCQDSLDYAAALRFNRRCRNDHVSWLWVTTGPMSRGYVSPVFLPDAGPCFGCLLGHFRRLSPAPELYDALLTDRAFIAPTPFPDESAGILRQLVLWKLSVLQQENPPAALYRLHVLEVDSFEVTTHRVFIDPECPECGRRPSEPAA